MKIFYLIIIILATGLLYSQAPDSLQAVTAQDSLLIAEAMEEQAPADTLIYDPVELRNEINNFIDEDQQQLKRDWFPWWYLTENKHYISLSKPYLSVRKNGFRIYSAQEPDMRHLQSNRAFYVLENQGHSIDLENDHYYLPVTITDAEAGMGDYRNMQGNFTMRKGKLLGQDSLGFCLNITGINGYWFGNYDTAANIRLHLYNKFPAGTLEYIHTAYSEESSSYLYPDQPEDELVTRDISEEMLLFNTDILDLGFRYESGTTAGRDKQRISFLLRKKGKLPVLDYDLSLEYLKEISNADSSWLSLSGNAYGKWNFADYTAALDLVDKDNYFYEASLYTDLYKGAGFIVKALNRAFSDTLLYSTPGTETRYGAGIAWHNDNIILDIVYGNQDDGLYDDWYMESYINCNIPYKNFNLVYRNWSFYFLNPEFQTQNELEFIYNLPYNNRVRFMISSRYYTDYYDDEEDFILAAHNIDLLLGIKISRNFEIRAEMINVNDNFYLLGSPVAGLHYIFNMYWYFIN